MSWLPMSDAMRRDEIRRREVEIRRAAEAARQVSPLRRPRPRRAD